MKESFVRSGLTRATSCPAFASRGRAKKTHKDPSGSRVSALRAKILGVSFSYK